MKNIIKIGLFGTGLLFALFCVTSCMAPIVSVGPTLTVAVSPNSGHPPFDISIAVACSKDGGTYTLTVEGRDPVESSEGAFDATVDTWPWNATIAWTDETGGFSEAPVEVSLENEIPVAHGLWTVPSNYQYHALIEIDLRYLEHGCSNGTPLTYTGVSDPDYTGDDSMKNDGFTYRVEVKDVATGKRESVFYGPDRTLMGDEYTDGPIFYWFVGYSGATPIIPYAVWSPKAEENAVEKRVRVFVKEFGSIQPWVYTIFASSSGCNIH